MLEEIGARIRRTKEKAIIAGYFNAKSPQWGLDTTDRSGEVMAEWIAQNDLNVANKGNKTTFRRRDYSTILDITLATNNITNIVTNREVSGTESLSDHSYVILDVATHMSSLDRSLTKMDGWQIRKLNRHKLNQVLADIPEETTSTTNMFSYMLRQICDKTMPRKKYNTRGKPAYWWNEEIAELRKNCFRKRRIYVRNVRRNHPEESERQWEDSKESKKRLRNCIKTAKRESWKTLCDNVPVIYGGTDIFKIVMKRLTGFPPRPQRAMQRVEEVANHLFPVHDQVIFNCDNTVIFLDFTIDELHVACERLKCNKAPGP